MWAVSSVRLKRKILALTSLQSQKQELQYLPEGAVVEVTGNRRSDGPTLIVVRWNGSDFAVFAVDLEQRSEAAKASAA